MRDIILYDRSGQPVLHRDADTLKTDTPVEGEKAIFTHGVVMNDVKIPLDFSSGGDQTISVPNGYLVREATIIKPEALKPENIKKDEVIAGVVGNLKADTEEVTVDLNMENGDQEIFPSSGDVSISKATVKKPEAFNSSNIRNGVTIAGITGDFIGDTEEIQIEPNFADGNFSVEPTQKGKVISKVTIEKPASLVPENIAKDTIVAGVIGTFDPNGFNTDNLVEIVPVTFVTVPSGGDGTVPLMQPIGLKTGSIYQILWNNVSYILEAKDISYNGIPAVAVGNGIAWGGEDNGLPFAIGEIPEEYVSFTGGAYGLIIPLDGSITFKVGGYFITKNLSWLVKYVIFKNGDVELYRMPVLKGDICKDPVLTGAISTPVKESTVQYDFTYAGGWSLTDGGAVDANALSNVTDDRIVYATYTSSLRSYTITFYDGESVLKSESYEYGSIPSYSPEKGGYNFIGWQPEISVVTGNAEYYAQWEEIPGVRVGLTGTSCKPYIPAPVFNVQGTWTAVTWTGLDYDPGYALIWTDGSNVYNNNNRVLVKGTTTWEPKSWAGYSTPNAYDPWTDGTNIYMSCGSASNSYVLNKETSTWITKTWYGFTSVYGRNIWTDGENIYHSSSTTHYVLDQETSTWSTKTWSGLTNFGPSNLWSDGTDIYYSNNTGHYVLNKETSTWSKKTWSGLTSFKASFIWTDGENIYYSNGSSQYRLNKETSTWVAVTWNGLSEPVGSGIWTDGTNLYYSNGTGKQYVLTA